MRLIRCRIKFGICVSCFFCSQNATNRMFTIGCCLFYVICTMFVLLAPWWQNTRSVICTIFVLAFYAPRTHKANMFTLSLLLSVIPEHNKSNSQLEHRCWEMKFASVQQRANHKLNWCSEEEVHKCQQKGEQPKQITGDDVSRLEVQRCRENTL